VIGVYDSAFRNEIFAVEGTFPVSFFTFFAKKAPLTASCSEAFFWRASSLPLLESSKNVKYLKALSIFQLMKSTTKPEAFDYFHSAKPEIF
jgi:hypothetical protein